MPFQTSAEFVPLRPSAVWSPSAAHAIVQPAPSILNPGTNCGENRLLGRISSGICQTATELHRVDFERTGHRAQAVTRLQDVLADMKERVARKVTVKSRLACAEPSLELSYKAS